MKQSKIIGITGSISTGKSAADKIIRSYGYEIVDADEIAHEVLRKDEVKNLLKHSFGNYIIKNNEVDRDLLGRIIFKDENKRDILNNITHPFIYDEIKKNISKSKHKVVFVDIPLLIETLPDIKKYGLDIDEIWLIYASQDIQIKRLVERDNISLEYAKEKISSQMFVDEKKKYADIIIDNSYTLEDLKMSIKKEIQDLKRRVI